MQGSKISTGVLKINAASKGRITSLDVWEAEQLQRKILPVKIKFYLQFIFVHVFKVLLNQLNSSVQRQAAIYFHQSPRFVQSYVILAW